MYRRNRFSTGMLHSERERPCFRVFRVAEVSGTRQCHRQVWMQSKEEADESRPSTAELIVLVSWMLDAMRQQSELLANSHRKKYIQTHHVFPVCTTSPSCMDVQWLIASRLL